MPNLALSPWTTNVTRDLLVLAVSFQVMSFPPVSRTRATVPEPSQQVSEGKPCWRADLRGLGCSSVDGPAPCWAGIVATAGLDGQSSWRRSDRERKLLFHRGEELRTQAHSVLQASDSWSAVPTTLLSSPLLGPWLRFLVYSKGLETSLTTVERVSQCSGCGCRVSWSSCVCAEPLLVEAPRPPLGTHQQPGKDDQERRARESRFCDLCRLLCFLFALLQPTSNVPQRARLYGYPSSSLRPVCSKPFS